MDTVDIQILRELRMAQSFSPFPSGINTLRNIASVLRVDKETVRKRLSRLREIGALGGWHALLNPDLLSLKASRVWIKFPNERAKEKAVRSLMMAKNLRILYNYYGVSVSAVFPSHEADHVSEQLDKLLGHRLFTLERVLTIRFPKSVLKLTERDLKIYNAIRDNPAKPFLQISREAGLTVRAVRKGIRSLAEGKAIFIAAEINPSRVDGVAGDLLVEARSPVCLAEIEHEIKGVASDCLLYIERYEEPVLLFALIAPNVSRALILRGYAKKLNGVSNAEFYLSQETKRIRYPLLRKPGQIL